MKLIKEEVLLETEKQILETLKDWQFLINRLERLKTDLREQEFRITPTLSDAKVFVVGSNVSKVESFCFSRMKIKNEIELISRKLKACKDAYNEADLTQLEKLTVSYTCHGKSLRRLSKRENISQATIYRIRDRAVKKMALKIRNGVFC